LLINLELLPRTLNRKKSNRITPRAYSFAKKFLAAGVIDAESLETVQSAGGNDARTPEVENGSCEQSSPDGETAVENNEARLDPLKPGRTDAPIKILE